MKRELTALVSALAIAMVTLSGCKKDAAEPASTPQARLTHLPPVEVKLVDSVENKPAYNIGLSYDEAVGQFKPLSEQVQKYVDTQVAAFKSSFGDPAVAGPGGVNKPTLSLYLTSVANTPNFAAVAANGSSYLGKGQATPLLQRWVYLPHTKQVVTIPQMFPGNKLGSLLDHAGTPIGMEPIADDAGKIAAVRFVYATPSADNPDDAVSKVTLNADQLRDAIDPKYAELLGQSPAKPKP